MGPAGGWGPTAILAPQAKTQPETPIPQEAALARQVADRRRFVFHLVRGAVLARTGRILAALKAIGLAFRLPRGLAMAAGWVQATGAGPRTALRSVHNICDPLSGVRRLEER